MSNNSKILIGSVASQMTPNSPLRRVAEERKMTGSIKDIVKFRRHF